jgi:hypothetical protein
LRRLALCLALAAAACSNSDSLKRPDPPPVTSTTTVNFSTYLGNDLADVVRDIAMDSAGNTYAVGGALSLDLLPGAPTRAQAGKEDAFVAKFDSSGAVLWWTFLGGPGPDRGYAIEVDPNDDVVIGGSAATGFPVTPGAVLTTFQGGAGACDPTQPTTQPTPVPTPPLSVCVPDTDNPARDGFVAKLAGADGSLMWATYFGSGTFEADADTNPDAITDFNDDADPRTSFVRDIAVDALSGEIYLTFSVRTSHTYLPDPDYDPTPVPPTDGPIEPAVNRSFPPVILAALQNGAFPTSPAMDTLDLFNGGTGLDEILAKLSADGATLSWATYVGGRGDESVAMLVRLDPQGNPVVLATTNSIDRVAQQNAVTKAVELTEPIAAGGFADQIHGLNDFFLQKFALNGPALWSTYLGGSSNEALEAGNLFVDANTIVVAAQTQSRDFVPLNAIAFDTVFNGTSVAATYFSGDCGIATISPNGASLLATTYYGGAGGDACAGVALDASGRVYVTGGTTSADLPIRSGPHQTAIQGPFSAFLGVFSPDLVTLHYSGYFGGTGAGNSIALLVRNNLASSGDVVFGGASEQAYPLSASPARGTVTAPPAHGVLTDATIGF